MVDQKHFVDTLTSEGVYFFAGVPDSYLNGFCNYLLENVSPNRHTIAANEGNAVAVASGFYFATGKVPLVYMQNSGMGNALNPIVSLAERQVYSVPMILLIGWRGEPGTSDYNSHFQHRKQGEITTKMLEVLDIPYEIAENDNEKLEEQTRHLVRIADREKRMVAIVAPRGVFASGKKEKLIDESYPLSREEAIETILDTLPPDTIYTATTGRATRELYFLRDKRGEGHGYDFLNLGSMGHVSSVALGIAMARPERQVVCLDGDSAAIMHMGALTTVCKYEVHNMLHMTLNNGAHESVGGQPSAGHLVDFTKIAEGAGYRTVGRPVSCRKELVDAINTLTSEKRGSAAFMDVRIHKGLRGEVPPLKIDSHELIKALSEELRK